MDSERSAAVKTKSRTAARSSSSGRSGRKVKPSRNTVVAAVLLGSLSITGMLLVVLAPPPLVPDAAYTLMAVDSIDKAFLTRVTIKQDQWKTIYIHHTRSRAGNATTIGQATGGMADHFLIGNGYGCADGELQVGQRWNEQVPAAGVAKNCITICLVGDFDQAAPTEQQIMSLTGLVGALQKRLAIPTSSVVFYDRPGSPTGIGRNFPISRLANALRG